MNISINIPKFLGSALFTIIAWYIASGTLQHYFAGPLNEMATCILSLMMAGILFISSISKTTK